MNETISISLDFAPNDRNINAFINRMDEVIAAEGWTYSGFRNMYVPVNDSTRDETVFRVTEALKHTDWLKPYKPQVHIFNMIDLITLKDIDVSGMSAPSQIKLQKYEDYYHLTKSFAHPIIVDEHGRIRSGYISYLLAWKYSAHVDILTTWRNQPVKKLVIGKHVHWDGAKYTDKGQNYYRWIYDLREAVVPGDILLVHTRKGPDYMRVSRIEYITGTTACSRHRKVIRHETCYVPTSGEPVS